MKREFLLLSAIVLFAASAALAADAGYTIGVPGAPVLRNTANAAGNAWLSANPNYPVMAIVAPGSTNAVSQREIADADRARLVASEAGFPVERTKPEYYLGDVVEAPLNVDWAATYDRYLEHPVEGFLFDASDRRLFATLGGTLRFTWILKDGTELPMTYVVSSACSGRPRRIYWTDYPYNAPSIDLSGKFVKFFGPDDLLKPVYGIYTNTAAGISQVLTNRVVSGLVLDPSTKMLYAYGQLQGQVVMAYYDTGLYERILHVQIVEICRPAVNRMEGEIGRALKADGRGYGTEGLLARPTVVQSTDNRGDYYYQHQGKHSYSPKHGNVYPLRPTVDAPWNMEVYWMETDEMQVQWPFELDQYACDWPKDATVFVRGDVSGDAGRPVFVPSDYSATLMSYQEPEGHARAVESDGTFRTLGEGWSLLKLTTDDNVWFVPVHSVMRSNDQFFTLMPGDVRVGLELRMRGGAVSGLAPGFNPICDPDSPGYIYETASDKVWNPDIYAAAKADTTAAETPDASGSSTDTNTYASVVYGVRPGTLEVWWNTSVLQEDMPKVIEIPTLPQVYSVRWPLAGETPQIVIASQLGSASDSVFSHNGAIYFPTPEALATLPSRRYFDETDGGTLMLWARADPGTDTNTVVVTLPGRTITLGEIANGEDPTEWNHFALTFAPGDALVSSAFAPTLSGDGVSVGEFLLWNRVLSGEEIFEEALKAHAGNENHLAGCVTFVEGTDLKVTGTGTRQFVEKVLGTVCTATGCLLDENGPPAIGKGVIDADADKTPVVYAQNDSGKIGYNPNEEHAVVLPGAGGHVAWALRCDLNTGASSAPGVLVTYVRNGRKAMQWFDVALTNSVYPELAADCVAGKAFPGPHPIDMLDDPWCKEDHWDEPAATSPAFRDRKKQLWARAAGTATMRMYYRMQDGFAFPSIDPSNWPTNGTPVPWLSLLGGDPESPAALSAEPAAWTWRVAWPEAVPEIQIGRTLTTASSGLPEVWNAKSSAVVWPATDAERDATAVLFDPTVAQTAGFDKATFDTVAAAIAGLGIKQGAGGNATLRKGRWTFDGLPPNLSSRFYIDTTADVGSCIKLEGEMENKPAGVSLLHVNVLSDSERETISKLLDSVASSAGKTAWKAAIAGLATSPVIPSPHIPVSDSEDRVTYKPRDHYALFSMGATNYVTLIENDTTNVLMNVAEGDPISMHVIKVVPEYYVGRVVTREDPLNLLSQQLSVIYSEAFAGKPRQYEFEWRKCRPHADGSVPTDFDGEYTQKFEPTAGLTRFVIGGQGDTLANMVNTYYAVRYRAASADSPAYAAMGAAWSAWSDPPALAEGWVQRVLNNVTPFAQRMRDLVENEAETPVSMIVQAGKPYEGDIALNQDNLPEVGLIQLYETILSKAESMSLSVGIDDADANKQLQLAVARLADLYDVLGDEAWTDALNPTIGFGANFNNPVMTGFEMDYGALSSSLFCFDNQVPTLLDEELALLRGRTGENAPSTHISPYFNRLPWNLSKSPVGGEVAYMVNYDISGYNDNAVIDENDAAVMFPQGHGDAYGHYLSALSGYYRLLRNPYFTWGKPAMGEMVVADAVLNVDYYDEAKFAKAAYDVAKVASAVVDRTARKAWRDSGGVKSSGYLDDDPTLAFGYGEWASRGGFGALANWAVANALLSHAPETGRYWRYRFDNDAALMLDRDDDDSDSLPVFAPGGKWTIELQAKPDELPPADSDGSGLVTVIGEDGAFALTLHHDGLYFETLSVERVPVTNTVYHFTYTNATPVIDSLDENLQGKSYATVAFTNGAAVLRCSFNTEGGQAAPTSLPDGYDLAAELAAAGPGGTPNAPEWPDWVCSKPFDETVGRYKPYVMEELDDKLEYGDAAMGEYRVGDVAVGDSMLVAMRCDGGRPTISVFAPDGALVLTWTAGADVVFSARPVVVAVGFDYSGEISELRFWNGVRRTDEQLVAKREFVSPLADGLSLYLRTISDKGAVTSFVDEKTGELWDIYGGTWGESSVSGVDIAFKDEGLSRIDRSTVPELASLAGLIPDIQRKVDRMDAGLTPLGLAAGAIPFDLTPIAPGEDGATHYEQIRERAGTALANARRSLDKAQFYGSRLRMLQEAQVSREDQLETMELETKNRLIEYFGYPYEGDIGPGGTYPQGYDGPDLLNYAWMEPRQFGLKADEDVKSFTTNLYIRSAEKFRDGLAVLLYNFGKTTDFDTLVYEKSATGIILKPANVSGKRRACGQIQEKMGEFLVAYRGYRSALSDWERANTDFELQVGRARRDAAFHTVEQALAFAKTAYETYAAAEEAVLKAAINTLEYVSKQEDAVQHQILDATPEITGAGMTVNVDPSAIVAASVAPAHMGTKIATESALLASKQALVATDAIQNTFDIAEEVLGITMDYISTYDGFYDNVYEAAGSVYEAARACRSAYVEMLAAECAVETVVAEAERVIDERTLARRQAVENFTKSRYNEMFFRLARNNALSRYDAQFELAQRYAYLAAQAYDYETGLISSDRMSGDAFLARIIGTRTLGEFDDDGEPLVASDAAKGDGGLAAILAEMDENWLVLKPRLGINNPQPYATWFSLRHDLFRIYDDKKGDKAWRTELRKHMVDDLNELPEFTHYCQPLAGSTAEKEPGLVIPFPSLIAAGVNFFGNELAGGDASLDPTYFATHISAAGVHFEGYDDENLARTPTVYLVPVGEDRMRAVGDPETVLSWKVIDQTVPAPYAIGSAQLDDPDWTPLFDGATGGNDLGARIRKHPSFRAYYDEKGKDPDDDSLDCTRLVGRSAWNTRWLLIIPASSLSADREAALAAFINGIDADRDGTPDSTGVSDILLGLKTYSTSGN